MKRQIALLAVVGLLAAGCANGKLINPLASVANPVSTQSLATVEAAYGATLAAAVSYKRLCIAGHTEVVGTSCRDVVAKMQTYDSYAHGQILVARNFVKNNPTVDATTVISTAQHAVSAFQSAAQANGVK